MSSSMTAHNVSKRHLQYVTCNRVIESCMTFSEGNQRPGASMALPIRWVFTSSNSCESALHIDGRKQAHLV